MKLIFIALWSLIYLTSCNDSGSSKKPDAKNQDTQIQNKPLLTVDSEEILSKSYSLRTSLQFLESDLIDEKVSDEWGQGTHRLYGRYYQNQSQVNSSSLTADDSYCWLTVSVSENTRARDIRFDSGRLTVGTIQESEEISNRNGKIIQQVQFALYLQGRVFQGFTLNCQNTTNTQQILEHLGDILTISDKPVRTPSPVKSEAQPEEFGIQFYSQNSSKKINHTLTIDSKHVPKTEVSSLDLQLYVDGANGQTTKLGDSVRVYSSRGFIPGAFSFTFLLGDALAKEATSQFRKLRYVFEWDDGSGFFIKMNSLCQSHSDHFANLDTFQSGCPSFTAGSVLVKSMVSAVDQCPTSSFQRDGLRSARQSRRASGGANPSNDCDKSLWQVIETGASDSQISTMQLFLKLSSSETDCSKYRSNLFYHELRQQERRDETLEPGRYKPIAEEDLLNFCYSVQ